MRFEVTNREIKCDYDSFKHLIGDYADYKATFTFDEEWNGKVKTARKLFWFRGIDNVMDAEVPAKRTVDAPQQASYDGFVNIPDGVEDGLPFN